LVQAVKKCIFAAKQYIMFDTALKGALPISQEEAEKIGTYIHAYVIGREILPPFEKVNKSFRFVMNTPLDKSRYIHLHGEYTIKGDLNRVEFSDMEVCGIDQYIDHKLNEKTLYPPDVIFIA